MKAKDWLCNTVPVYNSRSIPRKGNYGTCSNNSIFTILGVAGSKTNATINRQYYYPLLHPFKKMNSFSILFSSLEKPVRHSSKWSISLPFCRIKKDRGLFVPVSIIWKWEFQKVHLFLILIRPSLLSLRTSQFYSYYP